MFILYWPLIIIYTIPMYIAIWVTLPFSQVYATVILFALIAFWSRLPGVGMPLPFHVLYLADLVDFFSLLIAINLGPFQGAFFSVFCNLTSRSVGITPEWPGVFNDTIAQFFLCLIIPFIHAVTGQNILTSMIIYTVLRLLIIGVLNVMMGRRPLLVQAGRLIVIGFLQILINGFYAGFLGNFLESLLKDGVKFSWTLFIFATVVIFSTKFIFYKTSEKKKGPGLRKIFRFILGTKKKRSIHSYQIRSDKHIQDLNKRERDTKNDSKLHKKQVNTIFQQDMSTQQIDELKRQI